MAEMNTTRRGILGAIAAMPAIALPIVPALGANTAAWQRAVNTLTVCRAAHEKACADFGAAEALWFEGERNISGDGILRAGDTTESYNARQQAQREEAQAHNDALRQRFGVDRHEDIVQQRLDAVGDAEDALMRTPAPNIEAAIYKLTTAVELELAHRDLDYITADFRRLIAH
jgi:hypothetical protein